LFCSTATNGRRSGTFAGERLRIISHSWPPVTCKAFHQLRPKKIRRKAFDYTQDKSHDKKFILKVLIRDYNVRISEVKLGRNYQEKIQNLMEGLETPVNKLLLKEKLDATYKVVFIELSEELEENLKLADVLSPPTRRIKSAVFISSSKLHPLEHDVADSIMDHFHHQSINTSFERPISKVHKRLRYIQKIVIF
jgi:hypothetical protein